MKSMNDVVLVKKLKLFSNRQGEEEEWVITSRTFLTYTLTKSRVRFDVHFRVRFKRNTQLKTISYDLTFKGNINTSNEKENESPGRTTRRKRGAKRPTRSV